MQRPKPSDEQADADAVEKSPEAGTPDAIDAGQDGEFVGDESDRRRDDPGSDAQPSRYLQPPGQQNYIAGADVDDFAGYFRTHRGKTIKSFGYDDNGTQPRSNEGYLEPNLGMCGKNRHLF